MLCHALLYFVKFQFYLYYNFRHLQVLKSFGPCHRLTFIFWTKQNTELVCELACVYFTRNKFIPFHFLQFLSKELCDFFTMQKMLKYTLAYCVPKILHCTLLIEVTGNVTLYDKIISLGSFRKSLSDIVMQCLTLSNILPHRPTPHCHPILDEFYLWRS
jgi:hypothetical protein